MALALLASLSAMSGQDLPTVATTAVETPVSDSQLLPFPAVLSRESRETARRAAAAALVENLVLHRCTSDRLWCAQLVQEGEAWHVEIVDRSRYGEPERRIRFDPPDPGSADPFYELWPNLVREPNGTVAIGLLTSWRAGFSGGGAMTTRLSLHHIGPDAAAAVTLFEVPVGGSAMIRACFGDDDMRRRREACHDDYQFSGELALEPGTSSGRPLFRFTTTARTYPGEVWRWEQVPDDRPPLQRRELVWSTDPNCSYRRVFRFDPAAGRYVPDDLLPECGQYLVAWDQNVEEP